MAVEKLGVLSLAGGFGLFLLSKYLKTAQKRKQLHHEFGESVGDKSAKVFLISTATGCASKLREMLSEEHLIVGFDAEWKSTSLGGSTRPKVAVIQLCFKNICLVIQIRKFEIIPQILKDILENPKVLKTGVGIANDVKMMSSSYNIHLRGCIDLRSLLSKTTLDPKMFQSGRGLAALAQMFFNRKVEKGRDSPQISDWENDLDDAQVLYAAADAFYSRAIFFELFKRRPRKSVDESFSPHLDRSVVRNWCEDVIDVIPRNRYPKRPRIPTSSSNNKFKHDHQKWMMHGPSGNFIARTRKNTCIRYIKKGIATKIKDDPPTIRLHFEPTNFGHASGGHYMMCRCVNCGVSGEKERLIRHQIVPRLYRTRFPEPYDIAPNRDVVPLCQRCKNMVEVLYESKRREISQRLNIPMVAVKHRDDVTHAAQILCNKWSVLPEYRKQELFAKIQTELKVEESEFSYEFVETLSKPKSPGPDHGELVAGTLTTEEQLQEFVKQWRLTFLEAIDGKYLSDDFDVNDHSPPILQGPSQTESGSDNFDESDRSDDSGPEQLQEAVQQINEGHEGSDAKR